MVKKEALIGEDVEMETLPTIPDAPKDIMSVLLDQTVISEIGLVQIKTLKGSASFDGGAQGTLESPISAIIIESEPTRSLWAQGDESVIKKVLEWSRRPICSSRNIWSSDNKLLQPGWVRGTLNKEPDEDMPDVVKHFTDAINDCKSICSKCPWAEYESAVSGRGQACRSSYRLLLYLPQEDIIAVLNVTPSSLRKWHDFNIGLQRKSPAMFVTDISTSAVNTNVVEYNVLDFKICKKDKQVVYTNQDMLKPLSGRMSYGGRDMSLLEAYRLEFRRVELEFDEEVKEAEF